MVELSGPEVVGAGYQDNGRAVVPQREVIVEKTQKLEEHLAPCATSLRHCPFGFVNKKHQGPKSEELRQPDNRAEEVPAYDLLLLLRQDSIFEREPLDCLERCFTVIPNDSLQPVGERFGDLRWLKVLQTHLIGP